MTLKSKKSSPLNRYETLRSGTSLYSAVSVDAPEFSAFEPDEKPDKRDFYVSHDTNLEVHSLKRRTPNPLLSRSSSSGHQFADAGCSPVLVYNSNDSTKFSGTRRSLTDFEKETSRATHHERVLRCTENPDERDFYVSHETNLEITSTKPHTPNSLLSPSVESGHLGLARKSYSSAHVYDSTDSPRLTRSLTNFSGETSRETDTGMGPDGMIKHPKPATKECGSYTPKEELLSHRTRSPNPVILPSIASGHKQHYVNYNEVGGGSTTDFAAVHGRVLHRSYSQVSFGANPRPRDFFLDAAGVQISRPPRPQSAQPAPLRLSTDSNPGREGERYTHSPLRDSSSSLATGTLKSGTYTGTLKSRNRDRDTLRSTSKKNALTTVDEFALLAAGARHHVSTTSLKRTTSRVTAKPASEFYNEPDKKDFYVSHDTNFEVSSTVPHSHTLRLSRSLNSGHKLQLENMRVLKGDETVDFNTLSGKWRHRRTYSQIPINKNRKQRDFFLSTQGPPTDRHRRRNDYYDGKMNTIKRRTYGQVPAEKVIGRVPPPPPITLQLDYSPDTTVGFSPVKGEATIRTRPASSLRDSYSRWLSLKKKGGKDKDGGKEEGKGKEEGDKGKEKEKGKEEEKDKAKDEEKEKGKGEEKGKEKEKGKGKGKGKDEQIEDDVLLPAALTKPSNISPTKLEFSVVSAGIRRHISSPAFGSTSARGDVFGIKHQGRPRFYELNYKWVLPRVTHGAHMSSPKKNVTTV